MMKKIIILDFETQEVFVHDFDQNIFGNDAEECILALIDSGKLREDLSLDNIQFMVVPKMVINIL